MVAMTTPTTHHSHPAPDIDRLITEGLPMVEAAKTMAFQLMTPIPADRERAAGAPHAGEDHHARTGEEEVAQLGDEGRPCWCPGHRTNTPYHRPPWTHPRQLRQHCAARLEVLSPGDPLLICPHVSRVLCRWIAVYILYQDGPFLTFYTPHSSHAPVSA